ncbi:glycoside hydrolase family 19 protein [Paraburkholderia phenoliruptrix]|uniref:glycoside hydrolase family 19 protein n=1 Tax=Paraburkholderia phenoliruptrix TaxID=252970 RepID=UPI0034CFBA8B
MTPQLLQLACGASPSNAALWAPLFDAACARFQINTPKRLAAFLATVGVESAHLTRLVENVNYSAQGLANTWPTRYAVDPKASVKVPNAQANGLAHDPEAIANNCYAGRNGNGDEASGDGWAYRGQGPIQLTGKGNIQAFFAAVGLPSNTDPATLQQPQNGALSAAWFWSSNGLNALADTGDFLAASRKVNLGNANSKAMPLGWTDRQALYAAACKALGV